MQKKLKKRSRQEVLNILRKLSNDYNRKSSTLNKEFLKVAISTQKLLDEMQIEKIKKNIKKKN